MANIGTRLRNLSRTIPKLPFAEPTYRNIVARELPESFAQLVAECRLLDLGIDNGSKKFLNSRWYLRENIVRGMLLGLDKIPPSRILDLGCGPGYFLLACRCWGHEVAGLDLPDNEFYNRFVKAFGITRTDTSIMPFEAPDINAEPYDWITGFAVTFDRTWGRDEWHFFLRALKTHLTDTGKVFFRLNRGSVREAPMANTLFDDVEGFTTDFIDYRSVLLRRS